MKQAFITKRFSAGSQAMINKINAILAEYQAQGFRLTLRQLYYQLVARDLIPNNLRSYKNTGSLVSDARQAGLIDWLMIEDRNRETIIPAHWTDPAEIVAAAARGFRINKWEDQPWHIEIMVEKDALSGVLDPTCRALDVGLTANKGYSSSSTMYEIGQRIAFQRDRCLKKILIVYLGDHDPSGIDMTRDVDDRLGMYSEGNVTLRRIALNMDQVELWQPPENPAKVTDSRFEAYAREFGESSWELDAVEPRQLANLVMNIVLEHRDEAIWAKAIAKEKKMRDQLQEFANTYEAPEDEEENE